VKCPQYSSAKLNADIGLLCAVISDNVYAIYDIIMNKVLHAGQLSAIIIRYIYIVLFHFHFTFGRGNLLNHQQYAASTGMI